MDQNLSNQNEELLPPPELVHYVGGIFAKLATNFCVILLKLGI